MENSHRQFTPEARKKYISQAQRQLVDKMLLERLSIAAISRVTGISQSWLYKYVKPKAIYTSEMMDIQLGDDEEIELECDEIGLFCGSKKYLQWLWLVLERKTRMIVAACVEYGRECQLFDKNRQNLILIAGRFIGR
ncbi:MAG: hypothetical protein RMI89_03850 [Gloeomargarita sp. SKYBB_i_bin120]|nr:hypothetical protein [Gloeomargarita sp. SKYG98]MCS7292092.1 hypothetical protein [Gloeomargarita sp. SKYB120]MDW8177652.1 hypothetical protein [Gloeomargarita sp. SKYBB_i_bin120]